MLPARIWKGAESYFLQMPHLTGPDDARQTVEYWADRGVTSFKAYMNITRAELKAAIDAAHKRGIKVTGHLCSVTYKEAAELGIDDLEHGFFVNTQLDPGKKPDVCSDSMGEFTLEHMPPASAEAKDLIDTLVKHHVAITSTLPVFEGEAGGGRPPIRQQVLDAMTPEAREAFFYLRQRPASRPAPEDGWSDAVQTRYGAGTGVRGRGRPADRGSGSNRHWRRCARIRRSARN